MWLLIGAAVLSTAMTSAASPRGSVEQPPCATTTLTTQPQTEDTKPWVDLSLDSAAFQKATEKAHINASGWNPDHCSFFFVRSADNADMTSISNSSAMTIYLHGPAELQLGSPKEIKTYSLKINQRAICLISATYQNCVVGDFAPTSKLVDK
jgi:hypothetical protein